MLLPSVAPRVRYTGMSLSYQLAGAIGGGLVPLFSTASLGWSGGHYWPVALITACSTSSP